MQNIEIKYKSKLKHQLLNVFLFNIGILFAVLWILKIKNFYIMFFVIILLLLVPIVVLLKRRSLDFFDPLVIFILIAMPSFLLRPFLTYTNFDKFIRSNIFGSKIVNVEDIPCVLALVASGITFYYLGYINKFRKRILQYLPKIYIDLNKNRVVLICILASITFLTTWYYFLLKNEFSPKIIYGNFYSSVTAVGGDIMYIYRLSLMLLHTILFYIIFSKFRSTPRLIVWVIITILTLLPMMIVYSDRSIIVTAVFQPIIIWYYVKKKFSIKQTSLIILTIVGFITFFGVFRVYFSGNKIESQDVISILISEQESQFGYWDNLLYVLNYYPERQGFYYGHTIIEDLYGILIPRKIWKNKPTLYGSDRVLNDLNPAWLNIGHHDAVSSLGSGYAEFGLIGALMTMFIFGLVYRSIYEYFIKVHSNSIISSAVYTIFLFNIPKMLRGSISNIFILAMWFFPLIYIIRYLSKSKKLGHEISQRISR